MIYFDDEPDEPEYAEPIILDINDPEWGELI